MQRKLEKAHTCYEVDIHIFELMNSILLVLYFIEFYIFLDVLKTINSNKK